MATSITEPKTSAGKKSILFVFTSASKIGPSGHQIQTGWWISEGGNCSLSLCARVSQLAASRAPILGSPREIQH